MKIQPVILGKGRAGLAIERALSIVAQLDPELGLSPAVYTTRGSDLASYKLGTKNVLVVANPHGLHAEAILSAERCGFDAVLCEKPSCVSLAQLEQLRKVNIPVAVFHGYRQTWGVQTLKNLCRDGSLGKIISIEGRYWQSSTAEKAIQTGAKLDLKNWKNDIRLSGPSDVYLDIGTHWIDAVSFLYGSIPEKIEGWRSYTNAEAEHRDSHVHVQLNFPNGGRGFGSISKTVHGATNKFEIHLLGSEKSAAWKFLNPDEIEIGEGRDRKTKVRKDAGFGSRQAPFHALGWLEGYIEISAQLLKQVAGKSDSSFPDLKTNLDLMETIFKTEWK